MKWIDSHCHLTDLRIADQTKELMDLALSAGIDFLMMGGVDPEDWQKQVDLAKVFPENLGLSFGLHPYFIAEHTDDECEAALDILSQRISQVKEDKKLQLLGLGETGLDFRPHLMKDSRDRQIRFFENQVELAHVLKLPLVLHLVQAFHEAMTVLDFFGPANQTGMVHGFHGSLDTAEQFIQRGFLISVGGGVTYERNKKLQHTVREMPLEWLVLETDFPDQPPKSREKKMNDPSTLMEVALKVAQIRGISAEEILDTSSANFKRVFQNLKG